MRIDKLLSEMGKATRKESARLARLGKILVNGAVIKKCDMHIDPEKDTVIFCGERIVYKRFTYIMMNKPEGYVSATEDGREMTVLDLLPEEERRKELFPCGRLDKNTLGLMILTNDGENAHRLLSPKNHVSKTYRFKSKLPISEGEKQRLELGIDIGGYITKPCKIKLDGEASGEITITEGKYHQIKRMLEAVGNKITYLERITFGPLSLDTSLERGEWRYLSENEEKKLLEGENI
ncbi:MAG: rRNA pseudouridine synthase [Clostridia bacterium]|nr:rRNA pseudouridine synthase [Clostridia bacterium]